MKNILVKSFASVAGVLLLAVVSRGQTSQRIDFAKEGSNSLTWEERVSANSSKSFVFYARKGQKLSLGFIDDTHAGSMDLGKISIEPNAGPFEMEVEVSKDYLLSVSNNTRKPTTFRISISLEDAATASTSSPASSNSVRVQFARGETSAMITKEIPALSEVDFVINARKGQTLGFTIGYDFRDSDVEGFLTEPGSPDTVIETGPKASNEFLIKKTGDHHLTVRNMSRKKITVTLYVDIN